MLLHVEQINVLVINLTKNRKVNINKTKLRILNQLAWNNVLSGCFITYRNRYLRRLLWDPWRVSHDAVLFIAFIGRELMPRYKAFPRATSKYRSLYGPVFSNFDSIFTLTILFLWGSTGAHLEPWVSVGMNFNEWRMSGQMSKSVNMNLF